jgi:hypothetical protein
MDQRRFLIGCPAGINIAFAERHCYAAVQRALSKELNGQIPDLQFVQL